MFLYKNILGLVKMQMKRIIVYGSGSQYGSGPEILKVSRVINKKKADVIAYFDEEDQVGMQKILFDGAKMLCNIEEIKAMKYDYIVIASYEYDRITKILEQIGVHESKIVQFFNYHFYLIDELFYKDKLITEPEICELFVDVAAARMALKY